MVFFLIYRVKTSKLTWYLLVLPHICTIHLEPCHKNIEKKYTPSVIYCIPFFSHNLRVNQQLPKLHGAKCVQPFRVSRYRLPQDPVAAWQSIAEADVILFHLLEPRRIGWNKNTQKASLKINTYLDVSENSGTPKSSILIGFSTINNPFWGTPIFGNTHLWRYVPY